MGDIKGSSKHRNPRQQAVTCEVYGSLSKQGEQHGTACSDAGVVWALNG